MPNLTNYLRKMKIIMKCEMTYCCAAGLEVDSRTLQGSHRPILRQPAGPPAHTRAKFKTPEKLKWSAGDRSLASQQCCDLSLLDCSAPSHNPQSVNHECTCTGLMHRRLTKGCTLHSLLAWCDVAGEMCVFGCAWHLCKNFWPLWKQAQGALKQ